VVGDRPASVRQWFQSLMQPDNPYISGIVAQTPQD
jgi:hypothetical protein